MRGGRATWEEVWERLGKLNALPPSDPATPRTGIHALEKTRGGILFTKSRRLETTRCPSGGWLADGGRFAKRAGIAEEQTTGTCDDTDAPPAQGQRPCARGCVPCESTCVKCWDRRRQSAAANSRRRLSLGERGRGAESSSEQRPRACPHAGTSWRAPVRSAARAPSPATAPILFPRICRRGTEVWHAAGTR